jgi:hypothetical protein
MYLRYLIPEPPSLVPVVDRNISLEPSPLLKCPHYVPKVLFIAGFQSTMDMSTVIQDA